MAMGTFSRICISLTIASVATVYSVAAFISQFKKEVDSYKKKTKIEHPICTICLENVCENGRKTLNCGHVFHLKCVKKLRSNVCPNCRRKFCKCID